MPSASELPVVDAIRCDACPVLCYIKRGNAGACDRYANHEGQLVRVDPHIVLDRAKTQGTPLVPFLDRELAEFVAWNVKPEWKLKGKWRPTTKHIFREAMRGMLPDEVMRQPKAGFAAPVDYWLAHDLRPLVDDLLSESQVRRRGLFRPEEVRRYVDEHRRGAEDWSMQIWQLLTLEIWMQLFMDGGARSFAEQKLDAARRPQPISGARLATA